MPFKSDKQRKYLYANEPEMAKRWTAEEKRKKKKKKYSKRDKDRAVERITQ